MATLNELIKDESSFVITDENARSLGDNVKRSIRTQYLSREGIIELAKIAALTTGVYMALC